MSEDASAVSAGRLYLDVVGDTTGLADDLKAKLEAISQQLKMEIAATVKLNADQARAELDEIARDRAVKVTATADAGEAKSSLDEAAQDRTAKITAKADTAQARTDLDTAAKDRTSTIKAKVDTGTLGSDIESIGAKMASIGQGTALAAGLVDAVGAAGNLAGALVAVVGAASQAAGVIGAIPGLLSAAAQGGGAVLLGFSGISGALKDMSAAQTSTAQSAYTMQQAQQAAADRVRTSSQALAQAQVSAAQSVASAQHNVQQSIIGVANAQYAATQTMVTAEHTLADAEYSEQQAQVSLTQARIDARENLIQTSFALRGAVIGEAQATLNLTDAQIKLTQTMQSVAATPQQKQQAQLDVQQAQLALDEAKNSTTQAQQAKATADKAGVEGSQQVVQAKHGEVDATFSVQQAEQQLARDRITNAQNLASAEYSEQQAQQALTSARTAAAVQLENAQISYKEALEAAHAPELGMSSSATALAQALAKLTPAGRKFVDFIDHTVMPELHSMQRAVQEAFLPGVQAGAEAALPVIGTVRKGLVGAAGVLGNAASQFGDFLGSAGTQADLTSVMANNNKVLAAFADAGLHAADIVRQLLVVTEPLTLKIADLADHLAKVVDAETEAGRASGSLASFFDRAYNSAVLLGRILDNVFHAVAHIFEAGTPAGTSLLGSLEKATKTFSEWTGSAGGQAKMAAFFAGTIPVAKQVGDALVRIVKILVELAKNMGGGQYTVLFSALNDLLTILNQLVKIPGLGPVINWILALSLAGVGIGKVAANITGVVDGLTKLTKISGLQKLLSATGITGQITGLGTKLKAKGGVGGALKGAGSKILGQKAVPIAAPGADRVFSVGSDGETIASDVEADTGEGMIAATGLRGVLASLGGLAATAGSAIAAAMSSAVGWVTAFVGAISLASIKTALFAAGSRIAAIATGIWEGATAALGVVLDFVSANPIILIIAAVAALVAGVIYAYTHFAWFRDGVKDALKAVGAAGLWLWHDVFDPFWQGVKSGFESLYNDGIKPYLDLWVAEIRFLQAAALWLWHNVLDPFWQGIRAGVTGLYNDVIKPYFDLWVDQIRLVQGAALFIWHEVFDPMWQGITEGAKNFVTGLKPIWAGIKALFDDPVKFVVDTVYDNGIARLWNDVAGAVHLPKLPVIKMASGGIVPGAGRGDKVPALLEPQERILAIDQIKNLGSGSLSLGHAILDMLVGRGTGGNGLYSGGGPVVPVKQAGASNTAPASGATTGGSILDWFKSAASTVGHVVTSAAGAALSAGKFLAEAITDPAGTVKKLLAGPLGALNSLDKTPVGQLIAGVPRTIADSIGSLVSGAIGGLIGGRGSGNGKGVSSPTQTPGNVADWIKQAIKLTGVPSTWLPPLETIAYYESSDNQNSINNWDSNAQAGDPSRGLFQTIMTTFLAYHQKGTSFNIYDAVANAAAAINYIIGRYGSVFNVPGIVSLASGGPYKGYDGGGPVGPGPNWILNSTGQDEWMLTPPAVQLLGGPAAVAQLNATARVYRSGQTATMPAAAVAARTGGGGAIVNVFPQPHQTEEEIGSVAARKLGMMLAG